MKWITHVPEKIAEAKAAIRSIEDLEELEVGYQGKEIMSQYGGVEQRWLIVYSEQAYQREEKTLQRHIKKELEETSKRLKKFSRIEFDCKEDAKEALERLSKELKYHAIDGITVTEKRLKKGKGRPRADEPVKKSYRLKCTLEEKKEYIEQALRTKGRFIIATNELDKTKLTAKEMLLNYKGQQSVERGFRFLKEPAFMTSSVFLKTPERIVALGMVMCLCLLVYMIAQRYLRGKLQHSNSFVPNQLGKPTQKPSMRWIFQIFEGVHLLIQRTVSGCRELVLNLTAVRRHVLAILGPSFEKIYSSA